MTQPDNHIKEAQEDAVRRAWDELAQGDFAQSVRQAGLTPAEDQTVELSLLGRTLHIDPMQRAIVAGDERTVQPSEALLVLRYLLAPQPVRLTDEPITFRELPGGMFYAPVLVRRTTGLLVQTFGDDLDALRAALERYPCTPIEQGDVGVRIQAVGPLWVGLVYYAGDEEGPASATLFYDRAIRNVYSADEVAGLATLCCLGLVRRP